MNSKKRKTKFITIGMIIIIGFIMWGGVNYFYFIDDLTYISSMAKEQEKKESEEYLLYPRQMDDSILSYKTKKDFQQLYNNMIAQTKELERQIEEREKELQDKINKRTHNSGYYVNDEEYEMLCKICEAEATGEGLDGKVLVANCIFNRIYDNNFPNTIKDVIFEKKQFSPIIDGRYYKVEVTQETIQAVDLVLEYMDYSQGALYFFNRVGSSEKNKKWFDNNLEYLFTYGGHEFFK